MGDEGRNEDPHCSATAREEACIPQGEGTHEIEPEGKTRSWVDDGQVAQVVLEVSMIRGLRGVQEGGNTH
jgi:hypothetical protein